MPKEVKEPTLSEFFESLKSKPLERSTAVKTTLLPGHTLDGVVHYIGFLWSDNKVLLEACGQEFVDLVDSYLKTVEARL